MTKDELAGVLTHIKRPPVRVWHDGMMNSAALPFHVVRRRELVWPREHGSWSLVLEPLAFGLLIAPSLAGLGLALAGLAGFFARRPLQIAVNDPSPTRRAAARAPLAALTMAAGGLFLIAGVAGGGGAWLGWLAPIAAAVTVFLWFDLRGEGRAEIAEVAGAAAFALVPALLAARAGWSAPAALAAALVMGGRSVPTVLTVRAYLRAEKSGERRGAPAVAVNILAVAAGVGVVRAGFAPPAVAVMLALLAVRGGGLLIWPRPSLRARTVGIMETLLGVGFVAVAAFAWRALP